MIVRAVIDLKSAELSEREWRQLFTRMTFLDAEDREVKPYRILKGARVRIPRGAWSLLPDHVRYVDQRVCPEGHRLECNIELDKRTEDAKFVGQWAARCAAIKEEQGLIIAQPGFGKTIVALKVISDLRTPFLVLVHTEEIFNQWIDYAKATLPGVKIGMLQGQTWTHGDIDVAMIQTLRGDIRRFRRGWADKYGGVMIDEAHHAPAETWTLLLNAIPARYRLGWTATETRADGMEPLMQMLIGPVIHRQPFKLRVPARVLMKKTDFNFPYRGRSDWGSLCRALIHDKDRNTLIANDATRQIGKRHSTLVLSRRIDHLKNIRELMPEGDHIVILTGKERKPRRKVIIDDFRAGKVMCLLSTQLAEEALDVPVLSRVSLTHPGKAEGRIIQQVGRALREHADKNDAVITDYVDDNVSVLRNQAKQRRAVYKKLKMKIVKLKGEEIDYGTSAERRRRVADRVRKRLERGRRSYRRKRTSSRKTRT